jgi:hypothetical protein
VSHLTNYAENLLADMARGQGYSLAADWTVHLLTAVSDSAHTKVTGTGYAGQTSARSLAAWSGTQGAGTTLASSGTSHRTSNNLLIDFGTGGAGGWSGPAIAVGLFDGTDLFAWADMDPRTVLEGEAFSLDPGTLIFDFGVSGGMSDYLANQLIDDIWRAQAYAWPNNVYAAYATTTPSNASPGQEPGVGGYARQVIPSSLSGWTPTQGGLVTDLSSGTGGRIGNQAAVAFPAPTANQGVATHGEIWDAASGGNMLFWRALAAAKSIVAGGAAPVFASDAIGITWA